MQAVISQPYLLLDVDGVLSPATGVAPRGFRRIETPDYRVTVSDQHGIWLRELSDTYELVWATSWGDAANRVYADLLGLPQLPASSQPQFGLLTAPALPQSLAGNTARHGPPGAPQGVRSRVLASPPRHFFRDERRRTVASDEERASRLPGGRPCN